MDPLQDDDDANVQLQNQGSITNEDETNEDFNGDHQFDTITGGRSLSEETFNEILLEDLETNQNVAIIDFGLERELINGGDGGGKEEKKQQVDNIAENCESTKHLLMKAF